MEAALFAELGECFVAGFNRTAVAPNDGRVQHLAVFAYHDETVHLVRDSYSCNLG